MQRMGGGDPARTPRKNRTHFNLIFRCFWLTCCFFCKLATCKLHVHIHVFRYDLRIDFRDLNNVTSLNSLGITDSESIWTPRLGFTNALGPYQTTVDALTSGVLVRESDPLPEDVTLSTECLYNF
jgi:hypothetical protein